MPVADTAQQRAGGHRTEALQRHQALAARVFARRLGDEPVVFFDPLVEWAGVRQQVADTLPGMARQAFEMGADLATKAGDLLWQDDAEFGDQPAQPIVGGRAFLDEALPRAVQTPDDPRGLFLDRDEAPVWSPDGFTGGGGIGGIVLATLAAHPVGGDKLRRHQLHRVAELAELPCPVVRARTRFHPGHARRQLRHQLQQFVARNLRFDENCLAVLIDAMEGKHILGKINANRYDAQGLPLSWFSNG